MHMLCLAVLPAEQQHRWPCLMAEWFPDDVVNNSSLMSISKWYWNSLSNLRLVILFWGTDRILQCETRSLHCMQDLRASELCMPETLASQPWQVAPFHLYLHNSLIAFQELTSSWWKKLGTLKNNMSLFMPLALKYWWTTAINSHQHFGTFPRLWIHAGSKEVAASGMEAVPSWKQSHAEPIFIDWHWDAKMDSNDSAQQNSKELYSLHASQTTLQKCSKQYTFTKWSWRLSNTVV